MLTNFAGPVTRTFVSYLLATFVALASHALPLRLAGPYSEEKVLAASTLCFQFQYSTDSGSNGLNLEPNSLAVNSLEIDRL